MGAMNFFAKSFHPIRTHLVSDNAAKSSIQTLIENALGKSRQFLRGLWRKGNECSPNSYRYQHRLPVEYFPENPVLTLPPKSNFFSYRPGFIQKVTSRWVPDSLVGTLSKESRKRILQGGSGPMLCFVGFALAKKPSLLTSEEELEGVSYEIRNAFSKVPIRMAGENILQVYESKKQFTLADLKIGEMIAKGCNAAVYDASLQTTAQTDSKMFRVGKETITSTPQTVDTHDNVQHQTKVIMSHTEGTQDLQNCIFEKSTSIKTFFSEKLLPNNLAVKVMFNYNAESNAYAIWRAMYKETLPAIGEFSLGELTKHKVRKKKLGPHPNIVEMYFAFADQTPLLPGAFTNYPQALPVRLLSDGCGRNMTLFLVMKRYNCNLKEYLKRMDVSGHTALLLFTQLLEALVHLLQNDVTHRDLKTDNILLDFQYGASSPRLAITDFGCCHEGLYLVYNSYDSEKGGNIALMAPEVLNAEAGPFSVIDYSRSDLWTAGTLAYEIYGGANPFCSVNSCLKNDSYDESDLPPLPSKAPPVIQKLVRSILHKNPSQRPSPSFAATVCQILLHAPPDLLSGGYCKKTTKKALDWMFLMSAQTYLETSFQNSKECTLEFELRRTFCARIQYLEVLEAVKYILEL